MLAVLLVVAPPALVVPSAIFAPRPQSTRSAAISLQEKSAAFKLSLDLGKNGKGTLKMLPTMPSSEAVTVQYKVPFNLNLENVDGRAVITKDGPGGERAGDVLRYCTNWTLQLPAGGGIASTVGSFGGALSWQIGLFDVKKAKTWDEVVEALVSNTEERTDTATLVFERPTEPSS
mmetsp:Transcript_889/g.1403  ORF Transcript_889/g.1403 Transcript_889/m.1403 type:complete len:175 (-) Transcript_889:1449-1973(-)